MSACTVKDPVIIAQSQLIAAAHKCDSQRHIIINSMCGIIIIAWDKLRTNLRVFGACGGGRHVGGVVLVNGREDSRSHSGEQGDVLGPAVAIRVLGTGSTVAIGAASVATAMVVASTVLDWKTVRMRTHRTVTVSNSASTVDAISFII